MCNGNNLQSNTLFLGISDQPTCGYYLEDQPSCGSYLVDELFITGQVTRATHVRTRVCPRVELILKIIIILLIIFLGFIKSKPC